MWNAAGIRPDACDLLERLAARHNSGPVWRGSEVPTHQQGVKILGTPLGHHDFVQTELELVATDHQVLLDRIPGVPDVQAAWLLLLHCAQARANYMLRMIPPEEVREFARRHDAELFQCVATSSSKTCRIVGDEVRETAGLPLILGGLGLRSAERVRVPAYWASWADCLQMIRERHPSVAMECVHQLEGQPTAPALVAAVECARAVTGAAGFTPPSWRALARRARPPLRDVLDFEPGGQKRGWQHEAASRVDLRFRDEDLFHRVPAPVRALIRSQGGPMAGMALSTSPTSHLTRLQPHLFRTILLRRLRQPLPLSERSCGCGRPLDSSGHHRAACAQAGVLGRRGFAVESAAARICREAGGRVRVNVFVRDMDLIMPNANDGRRLEVVVDGLPLFGGRQLAIDTTLVGALHADGTARVGAANRDGVALLAARRRKEATYPELVGSRSRCRLVVLGGEVGGRWSAETRSFLSQLAAAKAREEVPLLQKRAEQAWRWRWASILSCAAARAVAESLLGLKGGPGADGLVPAIDDVIADCRYADGAAA